MKKNSLGIIFIFFAALVLTGCTAIQNKQNISPTTIDFLKSNLDDLSVFNSGLIASEQDSIKRMPGATDYHIEAEIANDMASLKGAEVVKYTNEETQPLNEVYFELYPNQLGGSSTISDVTVDEVVTEVNYSENKSALRISLAAPLQPGESVVIRLNFAVQIPSTGGGNYGLFGFIDNILVLDGFAPVIPVYDSAGWHAGPVPANADTTFNDVSFYLVQVTAPADLVMVASGINLERTEKKGRQVVTFAAGPARDFYLAASSDFTVISETIGETKVNSYFLKDFKKGAEVALNTAVEALQDFSIRYGPYPYTEFDVVSTSMQGAIGIEYPGIIGINKLIYDPSQDMSGGPGFTVLEATVAHEVGHQWFYSTVGNDQANEPWLDESLTQYVTGIFFFDEYGKDGFQSYSQSWTNRWQRVDEKTIPIGLPAKDYQGGEYSAIIYGRGPLFIQALAERMGQSEFDKFLLDYTKTYEWQISTGNDFKQLAEKHCQCDLTQLFSEWVDVK